MVELLKKYIKQHYKYWDYIKIHSYHINDAICHVTFYTDVSHHYQEIIEINIWDMLLYLDLLINNNVNEKD